MIFISPKFRFIHITVFSKKIASTSVKIKCISLNSINLENNVKFDGNFQSNYKSFI